MTKQDYVTFETAKLLKEAGFDEQTKHGYHEGGKFLDYSADYPAPHLWHAMKWLRDEKGIDIDVEVRIVQNCLKLRIKGLIENYDHKSYFSTVTTPKLDRLSTAKLNYEEICDASIALACEWLTSKKQ